MSLKQSISILKNKHLSQPIVVLGAGADLKKDVLSLSKDINKYITISANDKPLFLYPFPSYIFVISKTLSEKVWLTTDPTRTIRISTTEKYSDYITNRKYIWYGACGAGALAVSLALHLGGNPVLLCGFDLFRKNHCDGIIRYNIEKKIALEVLIKHWKEIYKFHNNAKNIRVVGDSPLVTIFKKYNKNEVFIYQQ